MQTYTMRIMKQISTINKAAANARAVVYHDQANDEYIVKFHRNRQHLQNADYFTDDKDDAIQTAHVELSRMVERNTEE